MTQSTAAAHSISITDLKPIRKSKWPLVLGLSVLAVGLVFFLIGWAFVLPQLQATTYLTLDGHEVSWSMTKNNWRKIGGTEVVFLRNRSWGRRIQEDDLKMLSNLWNIESLDLGGGMALSDDGMKTLSQFKNLRGLKLGRYPKYWQGGPFLSGHGIAELAKLPILTSLSLDGHFLPDEAMKSVGMLVNLETLDLSDNEITDLGLEELGKLTKLKTIYLEMTKVSPQGIGNLQRKLPGLTTIEAGLIRDRSTGTLKN